MEAPCKYCEKQCTALTETEAEKICARYREYLKDQERHETHNPEGHDLDL